MIFKPFNILLENNIFLEKTRQELLTKQKRETPERVQRAGAYAVSGIEVDSEAFLNDWLVITTNISGNGHTYVDKIAFKGIMKDLIEIAKTDNKHYINSKLVIKSLHQSLDKNDIYIDCSCPDFKFRYDYWATKEKFKWGKLQPSNGKEIRNPNNTIGCMCKHLFALLRSNNFLNKVSDKIVRTIMANLDILVKRFNIDLTEFILNTTAYDRMLKGNLRDKSGKFTSKNNDQNNADTNSDNNANNADNDEESKDNEEINNDN